MRINKFLAQATGLSRRAADAAIASGEVGINGKTAKLGQDVFEADQVSFNDQVYDASRVLNDEKITIVLNKPTGYVVSRQGQGSKTIYELLPPKFHQFKPVGRLDKDSSGLLLLTNDGSLAHELTHPSKRKIKVYDITLDQPLQPQHRQIIEDPGIKLEDGLSRLKLDRVRENDDYHWRVTMYEGRNRQIRRTFAGLNYSISGLHRIKFGDFDLNGLSSGQFTT